MAKQALYPTKILVTHQEAVTTTPPTKITEPYYWMTNFSQPVLSSPVPMRKLTKIVRTSTHVTTSIYAIH